MPETRISAEEPVHDVLAAELFGMPAADPDLHHGPVRPPEDPAGIAEPHDVLAAEEFPMPAPRSGSATSLLPRPESHRPLLVAGALLLMAAWVRRRRARSRDRRSAS